MSYSEFVVRCSRNNQTSPFLLNPSPIEKSLLSRRKWKKMLKENKQLKTTPIITTISPDMMVWDGAFSKEYDFPDGRGRLFHKGNRSLLWKGIMVNGVAHGPATLYLENFGRVYGTYVRGFLHGRGELELDNTKGQKRIACLFECGTIVQIFTTEALDDKGSSNGKKSTKNPWFSSRCRHKSRKKLISLRPAAGALSPIPVQISSPVPTLAHGWTPGPNKLMNAGTATPKQAAASAQHNLPDERSLPPFSPGRAAMFPPWFFKLGSPPCPGPVMHSPPPGCAASEAAALNQTGGSAGAAPRRCLPDERSLPHHSTPLRASPSWSPVRNSAGRSSSSAAISDMSNFSPVLGPSRTSSLLGPSRTTTNASLPSTVYFSESSSPKTDKNSTD